MSDMANHLSSGQIPADQMSAELIRSVADLEDQQVLDLVRRRIALGHDPLDIVEDCRKGMVEVGKRYEQRQYYLAGLILAGEILREVMELIKPLTDLKYEGHLRGSAVLGTVEGDIHDAGKDLFQLLLTVHGFMVHDLGVNVPPADFVNKAREVQPDIIGLSCLIIGAHNVMKETIALLRADPQVGAIPVIIGGQVNEDVCQYVKADYWASDAMDGVRWCLTQVEIGSE